MTKKIATKSLIAAVLIGVWPTALAGQALAQSASGASSIAGGASAPGHTDHRHRATRHGRRAHHPRHGQKASFDGVALATWFGPGLFGNRTACGQILSHEIMGVANRTLPCGTLVKVSYKGKHLVLPVIDRGPYGPLGASWDLTEQAAQALKMTETEKVRTKVVGHVADSPLLGLPPESSPQSEPGSPQQGEQEAPPAEPKPTTSGGIAAG